MSSNKDEKQYGLILPKKQQRIAPKVNNVFGDNNDSDEEDGTDWVKKALQAEGEKNKLRKQVKLNMQKALKEDPTIFQYDEVYDDMERTKDQSKTAKETEKKKPRYIQNLLKAAERRKKEEEYRIERMVQKEREAEGTMYADKESFVTSAYRAKLEEFKKMEEEENKMDRLEAIADVRKQQDISGFYRHLYEQTIQSSEKSETKDNTNDHKTDLDNNSENVNKEIDVTNKEQIKSKEIKKNRQYRQRKIEEDSDTDNEIHQKRKNETKTVVSEKHKDVESKSEKIEPNAKKQKHLTEDTKHEKSLTESKIENSKDVEKIENNKNNNETEKTSISVKEKIKAEKRERSKIWEKRTVGPLFEAALQRYYARKSMRLSLA